MIEPTETFEDDLSLGVAVFVVGKFAVGHGWVRIYCSCTLGLETTNKKRNGDYAKDKSMNYVVA
jgi:hypothetical protein